MYLYYLCEKVFSNRKYLISYRKMVVFIILGGEVLLRESTKPVSSKFFYTLLKLLQRRKTKVFGKEKDLLEIGKQ